jgi:hypothetical protein
MRSLLSFCLMVVLGGLLCAQTPAIRWVGDQVWMYDTIQEAIDDCNDRDVVKVCDGTYIENIDFLGKAITVRSADNDPSDTVINGNMDGPVVQFVDDERRSSVLKGFSIINGSGDLHLVAMKKYNYGGGIYIWWASPTIDNCWIYDNELIDKDDEPLCTASQGGGIYAGPNGNGGSTQGSTLSPKFIDCKIYDNYAYDGGSACYFLAQSVDPAITVEDCQIYSNDDECFVSWRGGTVYIDSDYIYFHGVQVYGNSSPDAYYCVFLGADNIDSGTTIASVKNCLVYENSVDSYKHQMVIDDFATVKLINNTFADNAASGVTSLRVYDWDYTYTCSCYSYNNIFWNNNGSTYQVEAKGYVDFQIDYCCIEDGSSGIWDSTLTPGEVDYGENNTSSDPDFVDAANDDYHIDGAPCVDEGIDTYAPDDDFEGDERPYNDDYDIGADEYTG